MDKKYTIKPVLFFVVLIFTIVAYLPGLTDGFYLDDYPNIVDNELLSVKNPSLENFWQAAWSGNSSSVGRPLSYFSFSVNSYFSGMDAQAMKFTNIAIHLAVGILLFFLCRLLVNYLNQTRQENFNLNFISFMVFTAWLLHPLNLTGVLYVVQRMTSLAALFSVCALICYTYFRTQQTKHNGQWLALISTTSLFSLLGFLAKENAILVLFYLTCIELFIFRFVTFNAIDKKILKSCFIIVYFIAFSSITMFLILKPEWLENGYDFRVFTLSERLLTETRILVWYLKMIVAPSITEMSLYLDDFSLSTSLLQPFSTILSTVSLLMLIIIGLLTRFKFVLLTFGIFWFFSGHLLESTFLPLELAFEHRNYLPSFGIILAITFIAERLLYNKKLRPLIIAACIIWVTLIGYTTYTRADQWKDAFSLALFHVDHHPYSARAHTELASKYASLVSPDGNVLDDEMFKKADFHFKKAAMLDTCCSTNQIVRLIIHSVYDQEFPRPEFNNLVESLKNNKLNAGTQQALKELTFLIIDGTISLPNDDYLTVMYASFENNKLSSNIYLHHLLIFISEYHAAVLYDLDTSVKLARVVVKEQPKNILYRFLLTKFLVHSGQTEDALRELEIIEEKDTFGTYSANIKSWRNLIKSPNTDHN